MNVEHRGGLEKEQKEGVFEEECEKKDDVEEEKKDEVEEEKEERALDEEERWKKIQERSIIESVHALLLPFPYKAMEKSLQDKLLKLLERMRKL